FTFIFTSCSLDSCSFPPFPTRRSSDLYPNLYFVGMSNLGFQSVYQMLNARDDVLCERAFLPDDVDREELEGSGRPLTTLESGTEDRKSTRLNSSHQIISYAVFCLKKKK